jgi:glycyl-radical enzyme activating protein family
MNCIAACPRQAVYLENNLICRDESRCDMCEQCMDSCIPNAKEIVGTTYTIKQLLKEIEKDRMFYEESFGGVTLSGGEVMCQDMDYIEELVILLKRKGYHVTIDTCGHAPFENFQRILPYVDTFLYDIKMMDNEKHREYTGQGNQLILTNLRKISNQGAAIYIRLPIIPYINDDDINLEQLTTFLKDGIQADRIYLLPYHSMGKSKYSKLGRFYEESKLCVPSTQRMNEIKELLEQNGLVNIRIGG